MQISYRPLPPVWPSGPRTPGYARKPSPFKAGYNSTLQLLERELRHLGVDAYDGIVIEAGFRPSDIRLDGQPRQNARPEDPALILNFRARLSGGREKVALRYGCDTYTSHEANLRAIGLALAALRAVDRYGVTKRGEQYQGWRALPENTLSQQEARELLRRETGSDSLELDDDVLYKRAVKRMHPDSPTGSRERWEQLQRAARALGVRP